MSAVIEVQHLQKNYGDLVAIDDVSFTVEEGEIFGIVGPGGAGKTTALECIEGLRERDGGEIRVQTHRASPSLRRPLKPPRPRPTWQSTSTICSDTDRRRGPRPAL